MAKLIKGIRRYAVETLSLDQVNTKFQILSVNYIFLMFYTTLESVFVNTLLFRLTGEIGIVVFYRGITYAASAISMQFSAFLAQKKNCLLVIRIGSALYFLMYLVMFVGLNRMEDLWVPVAILSGTGSAFYWTAHMTLLPHYTSKGNRDIGMSILGIIQGFMTLCVPVISGFVIAWMPETSGYRVMFCIGMLSVVAQLYFEARLVPIEVSRHVSQLRLAAKLLWRKASCKLMLGHEFCRGFRDGTFAFILNMVLFELITDEALVGINTFLTGAAAIVGSWAYGRLVRPRLRARYSFLAALALNLTGLMLFWQMGAATVMIFSVFSSFFTLFIVHSCNNSAFDVVSQNDTMRKCMTEMLAFRELALVLGRIAGLWVVMIFPHDQLGYVEAMMVLTLSQFATALLLKLTDRVVNRKEKQPEKTPVEVG